MDGIPVNGSLKIDRHAKYFVMKMTSGGVVVQKQSSDKLRTTIVDGCRGCLRQNNKVHGTHTGTESTTKYMHTIYDDETRVLIRELCRSFISYLINQFIYLFLSTSIHGTRRAYMHTRKQRTPSCITTKPKYKQRIQTSATLYTARRANGGLPTTKHDKKKSGNNRRLHPKYCI